MRNLFKERLQFIRIDIGGLLIGGGDLAVFLEGRLAVRLVGLDYGNRHLAAEQLQFALAAQLLHFETD